jgi:Flp pilus assembly protein TadD
VNLGTLLFSTGRTAEALPHLARAAALRPNSAVILTDYGTLLAAAGRYEDAMRAIRRALEINPDYAPALDTLAKLQRVR